MQAVDIDPIYRVRITVVREAPTARAYGDVQDRRSGLTVHFVTGQGASREEAVAACLLAADVWVEELGRVLAAFPAEPGSDSIPPTPSNR